MKLKSSLLLLVAAMFPASPVQATPQETILSATVTGQFQAGEIDALAVSEVVVAKLSSLQMTAKDLIRFAGEENETEYPSGSQLLVDLGYFKPTLATLGTLGSSGTRAAVWVIDKEGNRLDDVSDYIGVWFDFYSLIYSGKIDFLNNSESTRNRFVAKLRLNFPSQGISMCFRGNCTEIYRLTAPNSNGDQREHGIVIFTGDGDGYFDERRFVGKVVATFVGNAVINID